jgi:hypothetical protein
MAMKDRVEMMEIVHMRLPKVKNSPVRIFVSLFIFF